MATQRARRLSAAIRVISRGNARYRPPRCHPSDSGHRGRGELSTPRLPTGRRRTGTLKAPAKKKGGEGRDRKYKGESRKRTNDAEEDREANDRLGRPRAAEPRCHARHGGGLPAASAAATAIATHGSEQASHEMKMRRRWCTRG